MPSREEFQPIAAASGSDKPVQLKIGDREAAAMTAPQGLSSV